MPSPPQGTDRTLKLLSQSLFDNNTKTIVNKDSIPFENSEQRNDVIEYI